MILAIIPARGGSKRIPKKNIKLFLGRPIISYAIDTAMSVGLFHEIMVSTENPEIAELAIKYGASVPFFRSEKNADDMATTADVLIEVITNYEKRGISPEIACCIYPTAIFTTAELLKQGFNLLKEKNFDTVLPIVRFSSPILRAFRYDAGKVSFFWPEYYNMRTQDLEPAYHDAGQFYWFNVKTFKEKKTLITNNTGAIILPQSQAQDIDTEEDWQLAEIKYQLWRKDKKTNHGG